MAQTGLEGHEPTLDQAAAEEALLIAARLQHAHRERLSLDEIKRTGAEVGIAPEFVEQAILMMSQRKAVVTPAAKWTTGSTIAFVALTLILQTIFCVAQAWAQPSQLGPTWVAVAAIAGLAGYLIPTSRATSMRLIFGVFSMIAIAGLASTAAHYAFERNMILERVGISLVIAVVAFLVAQWVQPTKGSITRATPSDPSIPV